MGYVCPDQKILSANLPTTTEAPHILEDDLARQLEKYQVERLEAIPDRYILLPLCVEPKLYRGWHQIHHLSYSIGKSMNCHIPVEYEALEYTSIDEAIDHILSMGRSYILVERDLAEAFRHIPVSEADWWLLGFSWDGNYCLECYLPFDLQTASFIFNLFAKRLN